MNLFEKKISSTEIYNGIIIKLNLDDVELPDGNTGKREYIKHPGGVGVVAVNENNEVLLVKQFRYAYNDVTLEIPAGKRDEGEQPIETGKRELREETGIVAENYYYLGEIYPTPGYTNEIIHIFAAKNLCCGDTDLDEGEFVQVEKIKLEKAYNMVLDGEIKDAKTAIGILKLKAITDKGLF